MKINIILPFFKKEPGGGLKVMYQYANQLHEKGHDVIIYHSSKTKWTHRAHKYIDYLIVLLQWHLTKRPTVKRPSWFTLNEGILSVAIPNVNDRYIREADILFSTWWATALEVEKLSLLKGIKHNLIQGYEVFLTYWPELVHESYKTHANHIVIASYLQPILKQYNDKIPAIITNAIDHHQFFVSSPITERNRKKIILLYSEENVKGLEYSLAALKKVYLRFPDIEVTFFCAKDTPPKNLPFKFDFYHMPSNLADLYNEAAIFVSASIHEGWGLPAMEAMACGCACVCTSIEGHLDFMEDKKNTLLVPPKNIEALTQSIVKLIEDNSLRHRIAYDAQESIKAFNWAKSAKLLEDQFYSTIK